MKKQLYILLLLFCLSPYLHAKNEFFINRKALVSRHIPVVYKINNLSPFSVGNGDFAFTADITGLQTVPHLYENGIPLVTQSHWGWHSVPNVDKYSENQTWSYYDTYGKSVPYAADMNSEPALYLRANPHRLHLGRVGFKRTNEELVDLQAQDITQINQQLDIWNGIIKSSFLLKGNPLSVETCVHPDFDQIAVKIQSLKLADLSLSIGFDFPYGSQSWGKNAADWSCPEKHISKIVESGKNSVTIERQLDSTVYYVNIRWRGTAQFVKVQSHFYALRIKEKEHFEFTCQFSSQKNIKKITCTKTFKKSEQSWQNFWQTGGAVDLSKSTDPRAAELERRIVLSQYLTAIQCCGYLPPQETGLTTNSWFGKFHLEMHWWHAVHFVLWDRPSLLEKSLSWYESILPVAQKKAQIQGYDGVRWPKMTAPNGKDSPSSVGVFLIWQQPHPIYFAELLYRYDNDIKILERYKDIVIQTAHFMASYAHWDEENNRYVLGPPLIPAQEIYKPEETINPTFELSYWAFGLKTAQQWRVRLGMEREKKWDHVIEFLSECPTNDGLYQNTETALNTFDEAFHRNDHPTLLGAFGMLPNDQIDIEKMERTLEQVMSTWNWQRTWGWDYPLVAMTAARVGRPDIAIDVLLMDVQKNTYLNNGHNFQSDRLPLYLPGNGGLLTAIAMMAAGWDGAPAIQTPGFPQDGSWTVEFENLEKMP